MAAKTRDARIRWRDEARRWMLPLRLRLVDGFVSGGVLAFFFFFVSKRSDGKHYVDARLGREVLVAKMLGKEKIRVAENE
jgi:hypothetical protein